MAEEPENFDEAIDLVQQVMNDAESHKEGVAIRIAVIVSGELLSLPEEIRKQGNNMVKITKELDATKLHIKNWELNEMQDITAQTIDGESVGKKTFSNESARKAELETRKDGHDGYGQMEQDHMTQRMAVEYGRVEQEYLQNRLRSIRAIAYMFAGMTNTREGL